MSNSTEDMVKIRDSVSLRDVKPPLVPYEYPILMGSVVFGIVVSARSPKNTMPIYARIPYSCALLGAAYFAAKKLIEYKEIKYVQRDASMKMYIDAYPERFPEYQDKPLTYGDVITHWYPYRIE